MSNADIPNIDFQILGDCGQYMLNKLDNAKQISLHFRKKYLMP